MPSACFERKIRKKREGPTGKVTEMGTKSTGALLIAILSVLLASCRSSPTGPKVTGNVQLSAGYVACTEVWLKIAFSAQQSATSGGTYKITRDSTTVLTGSFSGTDTTVIDTTTQPNRTYTYQAYKLANGKVIELGIPIQVTTPDTTSSDYTWELFRLGEWQTGYPSKFNDIAIVNDTTIIAVGQIYVNDSTTLDGYPPYNMATWNGRSWQLRRLEFPLYDSNGTQVGSGPFPANGVYSFSRDDIWLCSGGSMVHLTNGIPQPVCISSGYGNRDLEELYGVNGFVYVTGTNGFVGYYDGFVWKQVFTGTDLGLYDACSNDGQTVYIAGGDPISDEGILLKGNAGGFQTMKEGRFVADQSQLFKPYFDGVISTVWVSGSNSVYFGGAYLYRYRLGQYGLVRSLPGNNPYGNSSIQYRGYISRIRGNADNDMVIVGNGNTVRHFNGGTWQQLGMPYAANSPYIWTSAAMKGNTIVVAGFTTANPQWVATVIIFKRN